MSNIKLVITGSLEDQEFVTLKRMAEEKWPTQTFPVHPKDQQPTHVVNIESAKNISNNNKTKGGYTRNFIKGQSTLSVMMGFLASKPEKRAHKNEIIKEFERVKYKANSVGAAIGLAKKFGWVKIDDYQIVDILKIPTKDQLEAALNERRKKAKE